MESWTIFVENLYCWIINSAGHCVEMSEDLFTEKQTVPSSLLPDDHKIAARESYG